MPALSSGDPATRRAILVVAAFATILAAGASGYVPFLVAFVAASYRLAPGGLTHPDDLGGSKLSVAVDATILRGPVGRVDLV